MPGSRKACRFARHPCSHARTLRQAHEWSAGEGTRTVAAMLETVSRHMYAPTAATAGLSCVHHHTHVVPNHTPAIPNSVVRLATNAHGESPPVRMRPPRKNRFRDGCCWYFRIGSPVFSSTIGTAAREGPACGDGGTATNEWFTLVAEPGSGGSVGLWCACDAGECVLAGFSSNVTGEPCALGETGERSIENRRLKSFSKLPRMRPPPLTFVSLRPYGSVDVFTGASPLGPDLRWLAVSGRSGSRLYLFVVRREGFALRSSVDVVALSVPIDTRWEMGLMALSRTPGKGPPYEETEPADDGR